MRSFKAMLYFVGVVGFLAVTAANGSYIAQQAYNLVQKAGVSVARRSTLNFTGLGVTVTDISGATVVDIPGGGGASGYDQVDDNGTPLTQGTTINCTGSLVCSDAGAGVTEFNVPGGGGGNASTSGTYYITSGGNTFGPIFPMTPPSTVTFAWRNQGSATVAASGNAFYLSTPASAGDSIKGREVTPPATPWSIAIGFVSTQASIQAFSAVGMYVADNGTGKLSTIGMVGGNSGTFNSLQTSNWTNATTFSANVTTRNESNETHWLKIQDDGTNLNFSRSADGQNWTLISQQGRTSFLANPDRVGFFVNSANATFPVSMTLLSWTPGS